MAFGPKSSGIVHSSSSAGSAWKATDTSKAMRSAAEAGTPETAGVMSGWATAVPRVAAGTGAMMMFGSALPPPPKFGLPFASPPLRMW